MRTEGDIDGEVLVELGELAGLGCSFLSVTYNGDYHGDAGNNLARNAATESFEETYSDNGDAWTEDGRRVALRCWSLGTGRLTL